MRAQAIYELYVKLVDAARSSHVPGPKFVTLYWVAQIDWLREISKLPSTAAVENSLRPYKRRYQTSGSAIKFSDVKPAVCAVRAVRIDVDAKRRDIPVHMATSNDFGERQQDPFRRASVDDPLYLEEEDSRLDVYAGALIDTVRMAYLTFPVMLNLPDNNEPLEADDDVLAIVRRVIAQKDLLDEKYNRYQVLAGQVIPAAEKPTT